jgi:hypothetical protein
VVQIYYIGATGLESRIEQALRSIADPTTGIAVSTAIPVPLGLSIDIDIDPRYLEDSVVESVRSTLLDPAIGPLAPERIGIGRPLYRSHVFRAIAGVPGAVAVRSLQMNGAVFLVFAVSAGAGRYFDVTGRLSINGKVV